MLHFILNLRFICDMRIFQVIESSTNLSLITNQTWYRNLYEPLIEMGHEVVLFLAEEGRQAMHRNDAKVRENFSQKILDKFKREHEKKTFLPVICLLNGWHD